MVRPPARRRPGLTLLELMAVMAAILILGAVVLPSITAFRGNTRIKAAADAVRGRMAEARMMAMEKGQAVRLAVSGDGKRLRLTAAAAADDAAAAFSREDDLPEQVSAEVVMDMDSPAPTEAGGWTRVATFQPDGTCKEDAVELLLRELGVTPLLVKLRGLTGAATVQSAPTMGN